MAANFIHDIVFLVRQRAVVVAALICLAIATASCRTVGKVTVEVPVYVHDTSYVSQHIHDSIYVENTEYIKGDTVYKTKWKYVEKVKMDTVYKYVEKPVDVYNEIVTTKYVEKQLRWWQKSLMFFGGLLLFGMVCFVVMLFFKTKT